MPHLIDSLKQLLASARNDEPTWDNLAFFAMFLLAELKIEESLPVFLEIFKLPDGSLFDSYAEVLNLLDR